MSVAVDLTRRMEQGRSNDSELWFFVLFCFQGDVLDISLCVTLSLY